MTIDLHAMEIEKCPPASGGSEKHLVEKRSKGKFQII